MISIGFFSEMNLAAHNDGTINDFIVDKIDYDKQMIIDYLNSFRYKASCPQAAIDCVTGEETSPSFRIINDGEYCWPDFLAFHIEKYNIRLPQAFVDKIMSKTA